MLFIIIRTKINIVRNNYYYAMIIALIILPIFLYYNTLNIIYITKITISYCIVTIFFTEVIYAVFQQFLFIIFIKIDDAYLCSPTVIHIRMHNMSKSFSAFFSSLSLVCNLYTKVYKVIVVK